MYQGFKGKLEAVGLGRVTGGRIGTTQRTRALDPAESGHLSFETIMRPIRPREDPSFRPCDHFRNSYRRARTDGIGDETPNCLGDDFST